MRVPLTLAGGDYDRTHPLASGAIRPDGVDAGFPALPVEETFLGMTRHREFSPDQGASLFAAGTREAFVI